MDFIKKTEEVFADGLNKVIHLPQVPHGHPFENLAENFNCSNLKEEEKFLYLNSILWSWSQLNLDLKKIPVSEIHILNDSRTELPENLCLIFLRNLSTRNWDIIAEIIKLTAEKKYILPDLLFYKLLVAWGDIYERAGNFSCVKWSDVCKIISFSGFYLISANPIWSKKFYRGYYIYPDDELKILNDWSNYTEYQKLEYLEFLYNSSLEKFLNFILDNWKNEKKDIKLGILKLLDSHEFNENYNYEKLEDFLKNIVLKEKSDELVNLGFNIYVKNYNGCFQTNLRKLLSNEQSVISDFSSFICEHIQSVPEEKIFEYVHPLSFLRVEDVARISDIMKRNHFTNLLVSLILKFKCTRTLDILNIFYLSNQIILTGEQLAQLQKLLKGNFDFAFQHYIKNLSNLSITPGFSKWNASEKAVELFFARYHGIQIPLYIFESVVISMPASSICHLNAWMESLPSEKQNYSYRQPKLIEFALEKSEIEKEFDKCH